MRTTRTTKTSTLVTAGILLSIGMAVCGSNAEAATGVAMASVRILPPTRVAVLNQPTSITFSANDIKRGFVDSSKAQIVTLAGSGADGFAVSFEPVGGPLKGVEVHRLNAPAKSGSSQLFVGSLEASDVKFRFVLDSKVRPVASITHLLVTYHAY